MLSIQSLICKF